MNDNPSQQSRLLESNYHRETPSFTSTNPLPRDMSTSSHADDSQSTVRNKTSPEAMKRIVRRFYDDIWNKFDLEPVDALISPNVTFRGTLSETTQDREGYKRYVREIQAAFPDFYQRIDALFVDEANDTCVARMMWSGTHSATFRGVAATGRTFEYPGVGIFKIQGERIVDCWVVGDTWKMWKVITAQ